MRMLSNNRKVEGLTQRLIQSSAQGHWFLLVCGLLGLACSLCAFPVIPIIVTACLISPKRWRSIALSVSLGCSIGAVILVSLFHYLGWAMVYKYFPEFLHHPAWESVLNWITLYGGVGLFGIAASPFPEMPALIVYGIAKPDMTVTFIAILCGKTIKYGLIAWLASHFPNKFTNGINVFLQWIKRN